MRLIAGGSQFAAIPRGAPGKVVAVVVAMGSFVGRSFKEPLGIAPPTPVVEGKDPDMATLVVVFVSPVELMALYNPRYVARSTRKTSLKVMSGAKLPTNMFGTHANHIGVADRARDEGAEPADEKLIHNHARMLAVVQRFHPPSLLVGAPSLE